ncbi:MAG: elongation factor P-like protein YeiP [Desulfobacterales bacterium]|nr:elongation factor P-like protein YeiP [Desulfobacterales bacterium]MDD4072669.1 elongation factor P-like protein YeiP [Desulfobacterales bacterium]MDD4391778.1 elongation factor P-like protein YeiP [Desulfobacterales bacterium]
MPKASEFKKGMIVSIDDQVCIVKQVEVQSPSSRGAPTLYKVRFTNIQTGRKIDQSFKGDQFLANVEVDRRPVQYLYRDGDMLTFMDMEDYNQHSVSADDIEDQMPWLTDGMEGITALLIEGYILSIELPQTVELEIIDTGPAIKGATANARTKPATLSNGIEIQVPEYVEAGLMVKVNTETGKFLSRA